VDSGGGGGESGAGGGEVATEGGEGGEGMHRHIFGVIQGSSAGAG
jgi:hypothetical protein